MSGLSDADKSRARYHLGYLASSFAGSIQLGLPKPLQVVFVLEDALQLLIEPGAVARLRCILDTMDGIEAQMRGALGSLLASQLGNMKLHPLADKKGELFTDSLEREYVRWGQRASDILGAPPYWFSARYQRRGPGSSVPVRG